MILKYGTHDHADGECNVSISRRTWRDGADRFRGCIETWTIAGMLFGAGADLIADLTTKIGVLKAAYDDDGLDLILYESDGFTETAHKLTSASAQGGTRVLAGPSFPSGRGAEYATHRSYTITVEAKFQIAVETVVEFDETIAVTGTGGVRFILHIPVTGTPVKQEVADHTPVVLSQDGRAVGRDEYPTAPGPVSIETEHVERRRISRKNPKRLADGSYEDYEISWHYEFEAESDFSEADKTPGSWG